MKADEAAKKYCSECIQIRVCPIPCTPVLMELWQEHNGKTSIPQMEEQMKKARRKYLNASKKHSSEI